jgi:alpha-beta hydrolase superfamily lysophospholipase
VAVALLLLAAPVAAVMAVGRPAFGPSTPDAVSPAASPPPAQVPRFTEEAFVAEDGARLPLRKWLPQGRVKAVILGLHGFNDYSHAFDMPARLWAQRGIATYAYDQRGFGGAPERGRWAGEGRLALDAIEASRILRQTYPGRRVYLLGESMGGAVAILAMTGAMHGVIPTGTTMPVADADGVILAAPAVWGRITMDLLPKVALFTAARLLPYLSLTGGGLHIVASDNKAMLLELSLDPMMLRGARVATIYGLVNLMDDALSAAPLLEKPFLLMYGAKDQIIPRSAITDFAARLPDGGDHRLAYYPHGYHMLLRDLDGPELTADVTSWILHPDAQLPSGADAAGGVRPWPPHEPRRLHNTAPQIDAARPPPAPALPLASAGARG